MSSVNKSVGPSVYPAVHNPLRVPSALVGGSGGGGPPPIPSNAIVDRFGQYVLDRQGEYILTRNGVATTVWDDSGVWNDSGVWTE